MKLKIILISAGILAIVVFTVLGCVDTYSPEVVSEDVSHFDAEFLKYYQSVQLRVYKTGAHQIDYLLVSDAELS